LGQERLEPGASAFAQIRLERETLVMPGDRFILRQYSPMTTIGGGQVLDVGVGKHRLKEVGVGRRLRALEDAALPDRVLTMVNDAGLSPVPVAGLVSRIGSTPESVRVVLEGLAAGGQVRWIAETPSAVVSEDHFQSACAMVLASIESFHEANPLAHGMSREAVQSEALTGADAAVLGTILDTLFEEQKLEASNEIIRAYGRRVRLTPEEQEACDSIRAALKAHGLEVPPADEVLSGLKIASTAARKIVQFMAREGVLAKVNEELLVDQEVMDGAIARLRERKKSNANLSVGDFKDLVGVTRKYAIPLLEYFDRIRVTRRSGSDRVIL
jgi:selenocysteine-specific elongation factor